MKKYIIIIIALIIVFLLGACAFYLVFENTEKETSTFILPKLLEPYIRIEKNNEVEQTDFSLNGEKKEIYYYFDLFNNNKETEEFNSLEITPYVKVSIKSNEPETDFSFVNINLYYIKDLSKGLEDSNIEEITNKGEEGSGFEEYYECKLLPKYNSENENDNIAHYVIKLSLNTEDENYNNLTQDIMQKLELVLGYRNKN